MILNKSDENDDFCRFHTRRKFFSVTPFRLTVFRYHIHFAWFTFAVYDSTPVRVTFICLQFSWKNLNYHLLHTYRKNYENWECYCPKDESDHMTLKRVRAFKQEHLLMRTLVTFGSQFDISHSCRLLQSRNTVPI